MTFLDQANYLLCKMSMLLVEGDGRQPHFSSIFLNDILFYLLFYQTDSIKNEGILGIRSSYDTDDTRTLVFTFYITCHHSNQDKEDIAEDISNESEDDESDTENSKATSSFHQEIISKDDYYLKWFSIEEVVDYQKSDQRVISDDAKGWTCQIFAQGKIIAII